jgi:hypothetical protein
MGRAPDARMPTLFSDVLCFFLLFGPQYRSWLPGSAFGALCVASMHPAAVLLVPGTDPAAVKTGTPLVAEAHPVICPAPSFERRALRAWHALLAHAERAVSLV